MVWNNFSRVWSTSWWCDQNYDGVILKIDGVIKIFTVWSNVNGVMKQYFGVNKRPFFGNCVITPYGVMSSHVFSWCPLQTSRSSGRSMRPNVKQILIAQTPPPMPPLLVPLTSTFRTRTDPHIFNVFRNAQITLRILIICASYPFLLCLCFCSTYVLTLHILFTLTSFWFWHAFCFIRTAIRAAGGFQAIACQKGGCSTRSYSSIFLSIDFIFAHRLLLF